MAITNRKPLGAVLVEKGLISRKTLEQALKKQKDLAAEGKPVQLGKLLVMARKVTEQDIEDALNDQKRIRAYVLQSRSDVEELYGQLIVQKSSGPNQPYFVDEGYQSQIAVAQNGKGHPFILVTEEFGANYKNVVMDVRARVLKAYTTDTGKPIAPKLIQVTPDLLELYRAPDDSKKSSGPQTEYEKEFEHLIKEAYKAGASDLHFFREPDVCTVRLRVHGAMRTYAEWNGEKADKVLQVGFQTEGSGSKYAGWDKKIRQRVRIKIKFNQHITLTCRYEHAPGDDGAFHACIRIQANDKREVRQLIDLTECGLTQAQADALEAAVSEPSGMVILSGPTGSGKSTTLAALVKYINRNNDVNVLTVESPIERELPAFQTSVSDDEDGNRNEFASAIKSMLRRDPDVCMVGEIRDEMSAAAAASGVQTGHTLLTTVHAQSAIEIVERLTSPAMKIPVETVSSPSFLNALVFQMLLPVLDDKSKIRLTPENIDQFMDQKQKARFLKLFPDYEHKRICVAGSSEEHPEGLAGMTLCAEVVIPDDTMREHFRAKDLTAALRYWRAKGVAEPNDLQKRLNGFTAADHAISKVEAGMIDPRDLEAYFGHLDRLAQKREEVGNWETNTNMEAA
ncbi:secretion system protein E [Marinobacter lutaoensis]|uniref:Secretion system protein E n=1 Tax=Marinobacter lutaoensis TaxID=135739 RepID=A0A1V2DPQ4_9GAMM|nr:ATPase, T2SS/T4P/T4SS family [Marinobacter lutaoensis]ONF42607.1 secretion system protein E [Marinobacter lutaoensis]